VKKFSSVSSGSSRGSYLSDSLRLGNIHEEKNEPILTNQNHAIERIIEELIQTEGAYLNSLNEVIQVTFLTSKVSKIS